MEPFDMSQSASPSHGYYTGGQSPTSPSRQGRSPQIMDGAGDGKEEDKPVPEPALANLLDVSMLGWQDRNLTMHYLRKSRSVATVSGTLQDKLSRNSSLRSMLPSASVMEQVFGNQKRGILQHLEGRSSGGVKGGASADDFDSSLAAAPHASLIFLVKLYHEALSSHGFPEEASKIAGLLEGIRKVEEAEAEGELKGMDLLLKGGLLELYLRIQPYIPPVPSQVVKFNSLNYIADIQLVANDSHETMLSKAWDFVRYPLGRKMRPSKIRVLKDVTGYLMPGTLTLVLGPPGCGKSTLQSVLSGALQPGAFFEGSITYNDEPIQKIATHRLAAMVGHKDVHLPLLTVRETLEFARSCLLAFKNKHYGPELLEIMGDALKIGQDPKVEITMSMMGLKHIANRMVGNALMPTITEDERHRLTAAEMFSGAHAVYFFDQHNTAAEDSRSFDLLTAIRIFTRVRQITFIASLLQPSSDVFDLFDRVIVLNQGQVVYQGPRQDALPYFESIGYRKPKHLGTGEFLQEVTTESGVEYLQPGFRKLILEDFVISYKSSDMYKDILRVVNSADLVQELWVQGNHPLGVEFSKGRSFKESDAEGSSYIVSKVVEKDGSLVNISMDHTTGLQLGDKVVAFGGKSDPLNYTETMDSSKLVNEMLSFSKVFEPVRLQLERRFTEVLGVHKDQLSKGYVLRMKEEVSLLTKREFKSTWRNKFGLQLRLFQVLVLSLYFGFLLFRVKYNADQRNMNLFRTAFFVTVMNMTTFNLGQLPALMDERNVYYKQETAHFYRPISYLLAKFFGSLPFSLCEGTIWSILVYFLTGMTLTDGGWHFFVYYVVVFLTVLNGASMVRFFCFFARDRDKAGMLIGIVVMLFILFGGYILPRFKIPKYWIWMYYLDPMQWAITAMVINEYNSETYSQLCRDVSNLKNLPQCIGLDNERVGHAFLLRGQFHTENIWIGIAVLVLCVWVLAWNILTYLCLSKIQHRQVMRAVGPSRTANRIAADNEQKDVEIAMRKLSHVAIPITLSWHELSYNVFASANGRHRTVLSYVSGWGEPTDMVGIFGSEGGGKTALLNCLAGRKVLPEHIGGQILVNGYPKVQKYFRHIMGYVDKIDAYAPFLTVKETVAYSAAMRLGKTSSKEKQEEFVKEVLDLTELAYLKDSLVGSLVNDINCEHEKSIAIAAELVANPSVLFLDNPTKGLDSSSARRIANCLQHIASTGRLVIVTLSYPSQRILSLFTKVQILKHGGETVYFGPVGTNGDLITTYFEAIPRTRLCLRDKGVASYVLGLIGDAPFKKSDRDYAFQYRVSELALRNHIQLQHFQQSKGKNGPRIEIRSYGAPLLSQIYGSIIAVQQQYWRNVNYSWGRMIGYLITSLILGSVYYRINMDTSIGMNSRAGCIFISCVLVGITNAQNAIPHVLRMRAVHVRERENHQSNLLLYNIAYTFAEIPYLMVANLIFCSIFLPMTNIAVQSASEFFKYWFISLEFYIVITFLGMFVAVASPMPQIAATLVPIIVGIWISTSGLVVPKTKILKQFIWIFWTNPLQYALDGLTTVAFYCDLEKSTCLNGGLNPNCTSQPSTCPLCDCPRLKDTAGNPFVWAQISQARSLHHDRVPYDMLALLLFALLFRTLTLVAFKYTKHYKRT